MPSAPSPLLTGFVVWISHQLCCSSLDTLWHLNAFRAVRISPAQYSRCGTCTTNKNLSTGSGDLQMWDVTRNVSKSCVLCLLKEGCAYLATASFMK